MTAALISAACSSICVFLQPVAGAEDGGRPAYLNKGSLHTSTIYHDKTVHADTNIPQNLRTYLDNYVCTDPHMLTHVQIHTC